jgi:DNA-binding MarR family transcriptional regulator
LSARSAKPDKQADGRFAYEGLERAIHEKARLGILTSLAAHPQGLPFTDLKELCSLTDGNLNRHLAVLEESGLIESTRLTTEGRPQTKVVMTPSGRRRFEQYIGVLEQVVADALSSQQQAAAAKGSKLSRGWSPA